VPTSSPTSRAFDAVVIGAGAFGCSAAYHLARSGLRTVLVDRTGVATQTTPRAAGLTSQAQTVEAFARLEARSVLALERFTDETGEPLEVHRVGSLKLARTAYDDARLDADIEACTGYGIEVERIDPTDGAAMAPWIEAAGVVGATYTPTDVYVEEPGPLPIGYATAARRLGCELHIADVVDVAAARGGGIRVTTSAGDLTAGVVVDTAGAWARRIAAMAGFRVPLVPVRHQLLVTEPLSGVDPGQPICRVMDANVYARTCRGGLMLGGYEVDPLVFPDDGPGPDFDVARLPLDRAVLDRLAASVCDQLPWFGRPGPAIQELRGGLPTMTPDGLPFLGPVPGVDGMFVAAGCCVFGFSVSPAAGEVIASLAVGEPVADELGVDALGVDRFDGPEWDDDTVRRAAIDVYGHRYTSASTLAGRPGDP
jgi:glycine/D-amino acid oxidase-like deaminating enzyme